MTLVTEAKSIPLSQLTRQETELVKRINGMLLDIIKDAATCEQRRGDGVIPRGPGLDIDPTRTGRVLLIDGPRGSGKTSVLLTLMNEWQRGQSSEPAEDGLWRELQFNQLAGELEVHTPVLDFDPLPSGIPLQGWLLLPWKALAEKYRETALDHHPDADCLLDQWTELFEDAVIGWSAAAPGDRSVLERALSYQNQASGWFNMASRYALFVNNVGRQSAKVRAGRGRSAPPVHVVAIDDVDLQVERLPELIHATRLLHHHNVVYVLTGDARHLRTIVRLDYLRQHTHRLQHILQSEDGLRQACVRDSEMLGDALLAKALPEHATFSLRELTVGEVFGLVVPGGQRVSAVLSLHQVPVVESGRPPEARPLGALLVERLVGSAPAEQNLNLLGAPLLLMRAAQHAIDRWAGSPAASDADGSLGLLGELLSDERGPVGPHAGAWKLGGRLTTHRSSSLAHYSTDLGKIVAAGPSPHLVFIPASNPSGRAQEDAPRATRAFLTWLLVELGQVEAPSLSWEPDAGMAWTEYGWRDTGQKLRELVFHWPWLRPPTAQELYRWFGEWKVAVLAITIVGEAQLDLSKGKLLEAWVRANLSWCLHLGDLVNKDVDALLAAAKVAPSLPADLRKELEGWVVQLAVVAAPYFGLPREAANGLLSAVKSHFPDAAKKFDEEERRAITDALLVADVEAGRILMTDEDLKAKVREFQLYYREKYKITTDSHEWVTSDE